MVLTIPAIQNTLAQEGIEISQSQKITPKNDQEMSQEKSKDVTNSWPFIELSSPSSRWQEVEKFAFSPQNYSGSEEIRKWQTNAVLIIKDDRILYENYAHGFTKESPHRLWSVTKSLAAALIGKRLNEIGLSLDDEAARFLPALRQGLKKKITFRHLLQMSSGLQWNEFYETNPFSSHVVDMLYINNFKDMGALTASRPMIHHPGLYFNYSSGETNLLMKILQQTFEDQKAYDNYPWEALFTPLGIEQATWEQDGSGVFVGSSYGFMKARDLARFGRLMLTEGQWSSSPMEEENTKDEKKKQAIIQVLPKDFVRQTFQQAPSTCQTVKKGRANRQTYGLHWWLNRECPNKKVRFYPDLPQDLRMALGHHGQMLVLFPKENAIVVRFGADKKARFNANAWLKLIYQELQK
jgi:CubicO group peptidase (beta-lactamase class C family)